jgi:hypothetical protein
MCRFHVAADADTAHKTIFRRRQLFSGAVNKVSEQQPSEVVSFSYWSIKLSFYTERKFTVVHIIPSSWGFPTSPMRHQYHPILNDQYYGYNRDIVCDNMIWISYLDSSSFLIDLDILFVEFRFTDLKILIITY